MRALLIADVHSNLPALEAVLAAGKKHAPERIISLGDQVNLGPCPRETLALLHENNVTCLHGNHERYILSAMQGHPGFEGENFASLRFNASILTPQEITFPGQMDVEGTTLCHALPGDDRFPVFDYAQAVVRLLQMDFGRPTHIICGHGHNPTHISLPGITIDSIGSVGCMDDGVPGTAPYVIAEFTPKGTFLRPHYAQYDTRRLRPLFKHGGMADFCPIMARIACMQMEKNTDLLMQFVTLARSLSGDQNAAGVSRDVWQKTDSVFPWPDGISTAEFWKNV